MKKIIIPAIIILSVVILSGMQLMPRKEEAKSQAEPATAQEKKAPSPAAREEQEGTEKRDIAISGRLKLEPRKKGEVLILHGKDAVIYRIIGSKVDELKSLLQELGSSNLISVRGTKDPVASFVRCKHSYGFDQDDNKTVRAHCVPYYNLEVAQIFDTKVSGEKMPAPKRDLKEEARARQRALSQETERSMPQLISVKGKISAIDLRSPIKTLEVSFTGRDGEEVKKTVLITANTLIVKKDPGGDRPIPVDVQSLRPGQEVGVEYSRTERASEALAITLLDN